MKYITLIFLAVYLFPLDVIADDDVPIETPQEIVFTRESLEKIVDEYAKKYNVSSQQIKGTIECESGWAYDIQSLHRYPKDNIKWGVQAGDRELSFGLVQIHLPSHPTITKEQAIDPYFAIDFIAKEFSEGRQWQWTCWRNLYK